MRILCSILLLLFTISVSAQTIKYKLGESDVTVVQQKWQIKVYNPALDVSPFKPNVEREQLVLDREATAELNKERAKQGLPAERVPVRVKPPEARPGEISTTYIYYAKVQNNGELKVNSITWQYVFLEKETGKEAGRLEFVNKVNLSPGKMKNLSMRSASPPTGSVNVNSVKKLRDQYAEKVIIKRIEYADGSIWETK